MAHADLHTNFGRSFWFLQTAIEQLRQHDPSLADFVKATHLDKIQSLYDNYITSIDCAALDQHDKRLREEQYSYASNNELRNITNIESPCPPGLGNGIIPEVRPREWSESSNGGPPLTQQSPSPSDASLIKARQGIQLGAIGGERKSSSGSATRPSDLFPTRTKPSWLDPVPPNPSQAKNVTSPTSGYSRERAISETETAASSEISSTYNAAQQPQGPTPTTTSSNPENRHPQSNTSMMAKPAVPVASTWASIAAISGTSKPGPHVTTKGLTEAQKRLALSERRGSDDSKIEETAEEKLRAVWIFHLSSNHMTLQQISFHITEGALFSLNIEQVKTLPNPNNLEIGTHACAIFRHADAAAAFVEAKRDAFGPGTTLAISPYDLNIHLRSMEGPMHCRRRVKWARSKLFYDVTLARFKKDVLKVCGGPEVLEQIHFYNPGEATAVFASIIVAKQVVRRFRKRCAKKGHRYEAVECSFCHDFNEAPATLWTQFDSNGRLRHNRFDGSCGIQGLFSGPPVKILQDNEGLSDEEFAEGELEEIQRADADLYKKG